MSCTGHITGYWLAYARFLLRLAADSAHEDAGADWPHQVLVAGERLGGAGQDVGPSFDRGVIDLLARRLQLGASRAQVALSWLLARSPATLAIPGASSAVHLAEHIAAADLPLTEDDIARLDKLA